MHTNRNIIFQGLNRLCYQSASKNFWKHTSVKMLSFAGYHSTELWCQYVKIMNQILGWFSLQFCWDSLLCALCYFYVTNFKFYEASSHIFSPCSHLKSTYTTEWPIFCHLCLLLYQFAYKFMVHWLSQFEN